MFTTGDNTDGTFSITLSGYAGDAVHAVLYSEPAHRDSFRIAGSVVGNGQLTVPSGAGAWRVWLRDPSGEESDPEFAFVTVAADPLHYKLLHWVQCKLCEMDLEEIEDKVYVQAFPFGAGIEFPSLIVSPILNFSALPFDTCGRLHEGLPCYVFVAERADPQDHSRLRVHLTWFHRIVEELIGRRPATFGRDEFRQFEIQSTSIMEEMKGHWEYIRIVFPIVMKTHKLR